MKMKKVALLILTIFLANSLSAQVITDEAELESVSVVIEKNKTIEMQEAARNFEKNTTQLPKPEIKPLTYRLIDYHYNLKPLSPKMKVLTIRQDSLSKLYSGHIRGGFGNYVTPYLEFNVNNKRSDKYNYGFHGKHLSSKNGPVDGANSGNSDNEVNAYGSYYTKTNQIYGSIGYERNVFRYYGYDQTLKRGRSEEELKQELNNITSTVGASNFNTNAKLFYDAGIKFSYLANKDNASEIETEVFANGLANIPQDRAINYQISFSQSTYTDSLTQNRSFFFIRPSYNLKFNNLDVELGFHFNYENDTIFNTNNVHIYPNAKVSYQIMPNQIWAYAGIDGAMQKNTWRSFMRENMFLDRSVNLAHTNKTLDLFGGVKGNATEKLNFDTRVAYQNYKNLPFYVNNPLDQSRFWVVYDSSVTSVMNLHGEMSYNASEVFRVGVKLDYFNYTVGSTLKTPFHRPDFVSSIFATYNISNKLLLKADVYYISGLKGNDIKGIQPYIKLNNILDLNLRADYLFSKNFSSFINVMNITSASYQRYQYYGSRKINILAGVTYTF
jgi:hypothetical protein